MILRADPQEDQEPLSLVLYHDFCEECGCEPDPELAGLHPYVLAHQEKYLYMADDEDDDWKDDDDDWLDDDDDGDK